MSPLKVTRSTPRRSELTGGGFLGEQREIGQGAAAEIVDHQGGALVGKGDELVESRLRGEADDAVVARVHAQHGARALAPGMLDVAQIGAVRGAHLDQASAAFGEDVGNAKTVADLDELAARDDHLAVAARGRQGEQHGRGVVVDHEGVGGAGQRAERVVHVALARGALAACQVDLQIGVGAGRQGDGGAGLVGQDRASEVGVGHHASGVDHRPQRGRHGGGHEPLDPGREMGGREGDGVALTPALEDLAAQAFDHGAHGLHDDLARVGLDQGGYDRLAQHLVDRGQAAQRLVAAGRRGRARRRAGVGRRAGGPAARPARGAHSSAILPTGPCTT